MSLNDRIASYQLTSYRRRCGVAVQLEALPPDQRAELQAAVDNPGISLIVLARACDDEGYNLVTRTTAQKHRTHNCACYRKEHSNGAS